jgi:predicted transcriptional regulator
MFDLKKFREDNAISQNELAEFLGVQQPFISRIESGRDPMPDYFVKVLSEKYDVTKYIIG